MHELSQEWSWTDPISVLEGYAVPVSEIRVMEFVAYEFQGTKTEIASVKAQLLAEHIDVQFDPALDLTNGDFHVRGRRVLK